jgi:peptide/nickel transport system substrate-binding protein
LRARSIFAAVAATLFAACAPPAFVARTGSRNGSGIGEAAAAAPDVRRGGVLKIGTQTAGTLDPHFATSIADIQLHEQVYEHLTVIDSSRRPKGDLAVSWETPDGKTWTFTLRQTARFSDGRRVTPEDVAFSFNRLRNPSVASPALNLYRTIREIRVLDGVRVRFILSETNPEFASDVGDYHSAIVPSGTLEPGRERVGSGPFMIAGWFPGTGAILKRNPYYDVKGTDGLPLPYLDEIRLFFSPEEEEQAEALRSGELDYVGGLNAAAAKSLKNSRSAKVIAEDANMHWVIHLRSDPGCPTADNRVRLALKLATNHQAIINAVRPKLASVGNGFTPVGPAFGKYHLVRPPFMDLAKAKQLLSDAGYGKGLRMTLHVQNQLDAVPIAEVWKEQMAKIGVEVAVRVIPADVYYGRGDENWLTVDFGVTEWGDRATPVSYFKLAYTSDAPWNETHWYDSEFDEITRRIDRELSEGERVRLYHRAQEILIERGPVIVPYFVKSAIGMNPDLRGVSPAPDWPRTRFRDAYFAR